MIMIYNDGLYKAEVDENLVTIRIHENNFSNLNRELHFKEYKDWLKT